ncbi:MAG TPA: Asp-tRNA(Asn)/Glu-tRNA(Gln) amidotransferase subunit GatB [Thermoanaerobaculia bacterium]|nr:Asp-tRNA(Asn)/Glu-tRNA(Gln) amidotransferase subunit GatB [Thermoanaerobaculia bacterium]
MPPAPFEPVIGLEVHCQLRTRSKAFCSCPVVFGAPPNTAVCPVCLGYPGVLPVLNREMVTLAMRVVLATRGAVQARSVFARKNYFYPDLPKGYQISQYDRPLATGGGVEVRSAAGPRLVRLHRIHLEEDAGKSMHEFPWDDLPSGVSLVDLNRAGTPLVEIVTEPDLGSADEAYDFLVKLRRLVRWVDASDGNMEEGSLRCDANVSLRPAGTAPLGTKVEIKNLNSIAHVKKALEHEIGRQAALLAAGGTVVQETRLWDPAAGTTKPMRSKEEAMDYRYFPEPDLGTLVVDDAWRAAVESALPELPEARAARLASSLGLPPPAADLVCLSRPLADWYEEAVAAHPANPKGLANWLLSDLLGRMTDADKQAGRVPVAPAVLAGLVARIDDGTVSGKIAKELLPDLVATGRTADELIREKGLVQITDEGPIREAVRRIVAGNPSQVATYRGGKAATFGWFVGQVMKATGGKASPAVVNRLLKSELEQAP